ncbi:hypothetical protein IT407_04750 [Candidatus Uhrbacteria bacterium]|nr:hypothetical protein [Candidatus Uhrbacteria bacterium]
MDLETALGMYFSQLPTQTIFSGQRDGAMRLMIERILTASGSPILVESRPLSQVAGMYPVALVEFMDAFDTDRESHELAKSLFDGELGAHAYQIYLLNRSGQQALVRGLNILNRGRRATPFFMSKSKHGFVSNCHAGERLYSLIIAQAPLPKTIAAA